MTWSQIGATLVLLACICGFWWPLTDGADRAVEWYERRARWRRVARDIERNRERIRRRQCH